MMKKGGLLGVILVIAGCGTVSSSTPFYPKSVHSYTSGSSVVRAPAITLFNGHIIVASIDTSGNITTTRSSDYGTSWVAGGSITTSAVLSTPFLASNAQGVMMTWVEGYPHDDDFAHGSIRLSVSHDYGATWASPVTIGSAGTNIYSPVMMAANSQGFALGFCSADDQNAYVMFTSDCGQHWQSLAQLTTTNDVAYGVSLAATPEGFVATWTSQAGAPWSSVSGHRANDWSEPRKIADTTIANNYTWVASNNIQCAAVWVNVYGGAKISFSSDFGRTWTESMLYQTTIMANTAVSIAATTSGFIIGHIAWGNNQPYARFAANDRVTWSSDVVEFSSSAVHNTGLQGMDASFISFATVGDNCAVAWTDDDGSVKATFTGVLARVPIVAGLQKKNDVGTAYELFNQFQWPISDCVTVTCYNISKDSSVLAQVNPSVGQYEDHNQQQGSPAQYSITLADGNGNQSEAFTFVIVNGVAVPI